MVVATILGAFMQADYNESTVLKLEGEMVEMLVKCDPKLNRKYLVDEAGKPVLSSNLVKALYGTVKAAKLFWDKLINKLDEEMGFKVNPYPI